MPDVLAACLTLRAVGLPRAALLSGAGLLLLLAAVNRDARIAQRNLDRYDDTARSTGWRKTSSGSAPNL